MEVTIDQFIRSYQIRPGDAIRMKKKFFGMLDHYVIYLGICDNTHKFVANYSKGVDIIPDEELGRLAQVLQPSAIELFPGNEYQRQFALQRAVSRIGQKAYDLISNNCEHYKNWVHYGVDNSKQVGDLGTGIALSGAAITIAGIGKKDPELAFVGILAALLGAYISQNEKKN